MALMENKDLNTGDMVTDLFEENPNHIFRVNNGNDVGPDGVCEYGAHILRDIDGVNDVDTGPNNECVNVIHYVGEPLPCIAPSSLGQPTSHLIGGRRDEVGHKGGERRQLSEIKEVIGPSHVVDGVGLQELHETEVIGPAFDHVGSCIVPSPLGQQDSKLVGGRRDDVGPNGVDRVQLLEVEDLIGPLHEVGRETEVIGVDRVQLLQDAHETEVIGSAPNHVGLWGGDLQVGQAATIAPTCQNMVEYVVGLVKKYASNHKAAAQSGEEIRESEFVVGSSSSLCSSVEGVAPGRGGAQVRDGFGNSQQAVCKMDQQAGN
ncbi:hypothetical protein SESBI_12312 [Sesbania bispinosa]|nr:hypothetical protein SESBI_12312 [Sesbania bispinosa]